MRFTLRALPYGEHVADWWLTPPAGAKVQRELVMIMRRLIVSACATCALFSLPAGADVKAAGGEVMLLAGLANLDLRQITRIVRDGFTAALGQEQQHLIFDVLGHIQWETTGAGNVTLH